LFCLFACLLVRLFLGICCLLFAFSLEHNDFLNTTKNSAGLKVN